MACAMVFDNIDFTWQMKPAFLTIFCALNRLNLVCVRNPVSSWTFYQLTSTAWDV